MVLRRFRCRRNTFHAEVRSCHLSFSVRHSAVNPLKLLRTRHLSTGVSFSMVCILIPHKKCPTKASVSTTILCRLIVNLMQAHNPDPPKSTMSDRFLGSTNSPLPTKNAPSPPPAKLLSSSGCEAATVNVFYLIKCVILAEEAGNRPSDLINVSRCTSLHSDSSCLCIHDKSQPLSETHWVTSGKYVCKTGSSRKRLGLIGLVLIFVAESWAGTGSGYKKNDVESKRRCVPAEYYLAGILCHFASKKSIERVPNPSNASAKFFHLYNFYLSSISRLLTSFQQQKPPKVALLMFRPRKTRLLTITMHFISMALQYIQSLDMYKRWSTTKVSLKFVRHVYWQWVGTTNRQQ